MSRPLVTVKTLLAQARNGNGRLIEIAEDALITPAAADWLSSRGLAVSRVAPDAAALTAPVLNLVGDANHPRCQTLLPLLERSLGGVVFRPCRGHRAGLLEAVQQTCAAVAADGTRRGVVVVRDGAIVTCLANKHPAIRAAVVRGPAQLSALVSELGLNLLVLEHSVLSLRQMVGLIETFARAKPQLDPIVDKALGGTAPEPARKCACSHAHR